MMSQPQKSFRILLLGDSCYDYYHYGYVNRISPEAPIPVFDLDHVTKKRGMASNVYDNLKALGADVHIITSFSENKRRYIDLKSGQQLLRVDEKINEERYEDVLAPLYEDYDAIVISDYNKGFLSYEMIEEIIERFHGPIFIDTKKTDLARFESAIVKINELEYKRVTSYCSSLIVTRGGKEVTYGEDSYLPPKVSVHDACGAGDTFLASLAFEYLRKNDMEKAICFAMKAAAITVQKIGVYAPTLEEINE
jgi:bifunctional ADP-heptose synthase (sugar kinase/adenylyltransferase)